MKKETEIRLYKDVAYITVWEGNNVTYFLNKKPYKTVKGVFNAIERMIKEKSIEKFLEHHCKYFGIE